MARKKLTKAQEQLKRDIDNANRRLTRLRESGYTRASTYIKQEQKKTKTRYLKDNGRFRSDVGSMTLEEMQLIKRKVKAFMKSDITTLTGIKKINKEKVKSYNKANPEAPISIKDFDNLYDLFSNSIIMSRFGSDEIIESYQTFDNAKSGNLSKSDMKVFKRLLEKHNAIKDIEDSIDSIDKPKWNTNRKRSKRK